MRHFLILIVFASLSVLIWGEFSNAHASGVVQTDIQTIRDHRISRLSDKQIRELWEKAERTRNDEIKAIEKRNEQSSRERQKLRELCKDIVYKQRNSKECTNASSLMWMAYQDEPRSRERIFDDLVLGMCNFIGDDVKKLRQFDCIP